MKQNKVSKHQKSTNELKSLGSNTDYPTTYSPQLLEKINFETTTSPSWISLICTEFTSLCPKTNQPDFARIYVNYIPDKWIVESKSLKLYLFSFRNHGDFHETCIKKIASDLQNLLKTNYLEVIGEFTPRGGISIYPFESLAADKSEFKKLRQTRMANYTPGAFTIPLSRIY